MGLFSSINVAATGMAAERLRSDVIANNIANASTTRTQEGGPFKRSRVILQAIGEKSVQWRMPFCPEDLHPDAIQSGPNKGYVEYPNVNIVNEMVDLIAASRAYEANSTVIEGAKDMFASALEIGR